MRALLAILTLTTLAGPALAAPPLSVAEFERYVTGRTLTYALNGSVAGIEQYMSDRRVMWVDEEHQCQTGKWYPKSSQICFAYKGEDQPKCWTFFKEGDRLSARYETGGTGQIMTEIHASKSPLACSTPEAGA
ncbi:hypothetical protein [Falsirhodobacter sp. alg1]|uniref:hypothetical protein n=1 Tax=Falsirhodobacter sp. alg1 TaxID=1472418 RepID=UPI0005EFCC27|nr:hypothetical protein [Falsirhodobacter sp. alg1]